MTKTKNKKLAKNEHSVSNISVDRIIAEYALIAFSNISDFLTLENDYFKPVADLDQYKLKSVQAIEIKESAKGLEMKVKMHDKLAALKFLAHYFGLHKDPSDFDHLNRVIFNLDSRKLDQLISNMEQHLRPSAP